MASKKALWNSDSESESETDSEPEVVVQKAVQKKKVKKYVTFKKGVFYKGPFLNLTFKWFFLKKSFISV